MDLRPPFQFDDFDMELLLLRSKLTPSQRIHSMLDTRELLVGMIRGRLHQQHPDATVQELNMMVLEAIERGRKTRT